MALPTQIASLSVDSRSQNALSSAEREINCIPPTYSQFKLISPGKCVREHCKRCSIPGESTASETPLLASRYLQNKTQTSPYSKPSGPHRPPFSPHSPPATHGVLLQLWISPSIPQAQVYPHTPPPMPGALLPQPLLIL